ncbi:MAG TPA: hypothetical protein VHL53_14025 [Acidimicrobiia bacterium]|nr:hypothetical protein [Acidimicrobiia bacterium]
MSESLVTVRFLVARPLNDGAWTGAFPAETVIARLHDLHPERGKADVPMGATVVSSRVKKKGDPAHVAFYALRDHAFPEIELNGQIKPLDVDQTRPEWPNPVTSVSSTTGSSGAGQHRAETRPDRQVPSGQSRCCGGSYRRLPRNRRQLVRRRVGDGGR